MALSVLDRSFKFKAKAKSLKQTIRLLRCLQLSAKISYDIKMSVSPAGVIIRCMDASHISMLDITLPPSAFLDYHSNTERTISCDLLEVKRVFDTIGDSESVIVAMIEDTLSLNTVMPITDTFTARKRHKLRAKDASSLVSLPKLDLKVSFDIHRSTMTNILDSLAAHGEDYFTVEARDKLLKLKFSGRSQEVEITIPDWDVKGEGIASFSIEHVKLFLKFATEDIVTMQFSTGLPLKIIHASAHYYIAPRIDDKGDDKKEQKKVE